MNNTMKYSFFFAVLLLVMELFVLFRLPFASDTFFQKTPDWTLEGIVNRLKTAPLNQEVADDPNGFLHTYLPVFEQLRRYDISHLPESEKSIIAHLYNNLGTAKIRLMLYEEAIFYLELAVGVEPQNAFAHRNLGYALKEAGKVKKNRFYLLKAIEEYRKVIALEKKDSDLYKRVSRVIHKIQNVYLPSIE